MLTSTPVPSFRKRTVSASMTGSLLRSTDPGDAQGLLDPRSADEPVDVLPDRLPAPVAEDPPGSVVPFDDVVLPVEGDDPVGEALDDRLPVEGTLVVLFGLSEERAERPLVGSHAPDLTLPRVPVNRRCG